MTASSRLIFSFLETKNDPMMLIAPATVNIILEALKILFATSSGNIGMLF